MTGNLLAYAEQGSFNFSTVTFLLSALTAVLLQVLSNFANDYGDFKNGVDTAERTDRTMASGLISEKQMRVAIGILVSLCLVSGISLLVLSIHSFNSSFWILLGMGIAGIFAAYFYTAGKNPYGYIGLGDLSVFVFFGLLSVAGSYFLQAQTLDSSIWWVAAAIGFMSVGVLNVNNIRDINSDKSKNKITIPVRIGYTYALRYQLLLLNSALACFIVYSIYRQKNINILFLYHIIFLSFVMIHMNFLKKAERREEYNKQLKFLSLSTFILSMLFSFIEI